MASTDMNNHDVNGNGLLDLDVYFDFLCPFAYQAALWVDQVSGLMGDDVIAVRWKFFSLEQNRHSQAKEGWNIWDQKPDSEDAQGLLPFLAGAAAHAQGGEKALQKFYLALGRLRHEEGASIWEAKVVEQAWQAVGLGDEGLEKIMDGSDRSGYEKLKADHTEAVERYNVFGTPTLVFEEHRAFYLKLMPRPNEVDDALELFQHVQRLAMGFKGAFYEFKQPMTKAQDAEISEMTTKSMQGLNVARH